jgi:hypothetical protein
MPINKVLPHDIRKIIHDYFNDTDQRFTNEDILEYLNQNQKYENQKLDILDFEEILMEMENKKVLRPIAQNFNTRYYLLPEPLKKIFCNKCNADYFISETEKAICPVCNSSSFT